MRYLTFGRGNGLRVSEYALGTATFGTRWDAGIERGETARMLDGFADAGGTFLDTAESYQAGESEEIVVPVASDRHLYATANQLDRLAPFHGGQDLRRKPYLLVRLPIDAGPVRLA